MEKEKILKWVSKTEAYRIHHYENRNGVQFLELYTDNQKNTIFHRHYDGFPDFSGLLIKNPLWKRIFCRKKYAVDYQKTSTTVYPQIVIREAIGGIAFFQTDAVNNPVLAQIVSESEKKLTTFYSAIKAYFCGMPKNPEEKMYPLLSFFYEDLCRKYPNQQEVLEQIKLLFIRCSRGEQGKPMFEGAKAENPLEYLNSALAKGFPYDGIVLGYVESIYAKIYYSFFGEVYALSELYQISPNVVLAQSKGVECSWGFSAFMELMDETMYYLSC